MATQLLRDIRLKERTCAGDRLPETDTWDDEAGTTSVVGRNTDQGIAPPDSVEASAKKGGGEIWSHRQRYWRTIS